MTDSTKLIVRKAKDGINHEAVMMKYCGGWYERHTASGHMPLDAINELISSLKIEIAMLEEELDSASYGRWEVSE